MKFKHSLPRLKIVNRNEFILSASNNQNVLHLGAVDRSLEPMADLHIKITNASKLTVGADIDKEGINELKKKGISNIIYCNVEKIDENLFDEKFTLVIAGEIIEHLSNPGLFLEGIKNVFNQDTKMIITTPNPFSFQRFVPPLIYKTEYVHPEHTCYYSYNTLRALLERHGFVIEEVYGFNLGRNFEKIYNIFPHLATGLIFIVSLRGLR